MKNQLQLRLKENISFILTNTGKKTTIEVNEYNTCQYCIHHLFSEAQHLKHNGCFHLSHKVQYFFSIIHVRSHTGLALVEC